MDGDLPRYRRARLDSGQSRGEPQGESWGYSATIPAEIAEAQPGFARTDAPVRKREDERPDKREPEDKPAGKAESKSDDEDKAEKKDDKKPMPRWKKALYWLIGLIVLAALVIGGVLYWLDARQFENTDDAFIDGHIAQISARVSAQVVSLAIQDNQMVKVGERLLQLDARDYQVKVQQAEAQKGQAVAQWDQAKAGLLIQQANLDQMIAQVRVSEAELQQQQTDLNRYRSIDPKAITRQQLDTSSAQTKSAAARLDASKQAVEGARAQIGSQKAQIEAAEANVKAAEATLANAALQLSYTVVAAPVEGRITKRTVEPGQYANAGQSLFAIVGPELWVTANFKETQLKLMRVGQPVRVRVDACPDVDIAAHIDSFQSGTGAVFSSLPAENATGNYVKVVQRVPVKILFDRVPEDCRLSPGLSVAPRVTVR